MNKSPICTERGHKCPKCGAMMEFYANSHKGNITAKYWRCHSCGARYKFLTQRVFLKVEEVTPYKKKKN